MTILTTTAKFPTSGTTQDRAGATAWTNPGNITAADTSYATAAVPTDYLIATGYDFSEIPSGATILGVTVVVNASETGAGSSNYIPQLVSAATPTLIGSAKTAVTVTGATKVSSSNGGNTDLWGATLTPAIVKGAGFGCAIWSTDTTNTLSIDYITIAITYNDGQIVQSNNTAMSGVVAISGDISKKGWAITWAQLEVPEAAATTLQLTQSNSIAVAGVVVTTGDVAEKVSLVQSDSISLSGVLALSGDLTITEGVTLELTQADTIALSGVLALSGDIEQKIALVQSETIALAGAVTLSGDVEQKISIVQSGEIVLAGAIGASGDLSFTLPTLELVAENPVALAGVLGLSGDLTISEEQFLALVQDSPLALSGAVSVAGDLSYKIALEQSGQIVLSGTIGIDGDLEFLLALEAQNPMGLSGSLGVSGDIESSLASTLVLAQEGQILIAGSLGLSGEIESVARQTGGPRPKKRRQQDDIDLFDIAGILPALVESQCCQA